jgi:photosystem II stability/assembly factor-like uncharacterized protein
MRAAILLAALSLPAHAQWNLQQSNTTADLRGIDNVGHGIAWASGSNGTVLHTTDNGTTWLLCKTPPNAEHLDFRGVQAFDANTAIVMSSGKGDLSRLYKTTDGCQTWKLVFTNPDKDGFWDALKMMWPVRGFSSESGGILIGDPVNGNFALFRSVDEGSTWKQWGGKQAAFGAEYNEKQASARKDEALFAASNQSLALWTVDNFLFVTGGVSGARLLYSDEGALCNELGWGCSISFVSRSLPLLNKNSSAGAFAVASRGPSQYFPLHLMVVGGDYTKLDQTSGTSVFLYPGHNPLAGNFDVIMPTTPPHGYRSAVAYDAPTKTWITVGPNGTDISTDDGRNWRALKPSPSDPPDADQHWNALSLPFVVGPHGRIGLLKPQALQTK